MRTEQDAWGSVVIPTAAYWGAQTARALENFDVSGRTLAVHPELISALGAVKEAAALANGELGLLSREKSTVIAAAAKEVRENRLDDHFVVDPLQGGAGTSTNMNVNEVVANRALEMLGRECGDYDAVHPIDDVNRGQSTNDVYPTAAKLAIVTAFDALRDETTHLVESFARKGVEFADVLKVGRTQLQDAVPMTAGQEFTAFAVTVAEEDDRFRDIQRILSEVHLGGTAIGTGIATPPQFGAAVLRHLQEVTGRTLAPALDRIEATSDTGAFLAASSALRRCAVKVSKICNDLRLLSSGPQAGFNELSLPPRQAGSSIMPGKVNPVIPEMVNQVAFGIVGADVTVAMAAEAGQLQLNAFEPVMVDVILEGARRLRRALHILRVSCIDGIVAHADRSRATAHESVGIATALIPVLGYDRAALLAREARASGRTVIELAIGSGALSAEELQRLLDPRVLAGAASAASGRRPEEEP